MTGTIKKIAAIFLSLFTVSIAFAAAPSPKKIHVVFTVIANTATVSACSNKQVCDFDITLKGVNAHKVVWSSKNLKHPGGNMTVGYFVKNVWSKGSNSFAKDHPNTSITYHNGNQVIESAVMIMHPYYNQKADTLTVQVKELAHLRIKPGKYSRVIFGIDGLGEAAAGVVFEFIGEGILEGLAD